MKSVHHHSSYLLTLFLIVSTGPNVTSADNLALNKPATQEGIYNNQGASLAVDGDPNSCSFSNYGFGLPTWWQVDLLYESYITSASIQIPTSDDCRYMQGFVIIVSDDNSTSSSTPLCYTFSNGSSSTDYSLRGLHPTFTCTQPLTGRYVTIRRQGGYQPRSMSLCDVQVNGFIIGSAPSALTTTTTATSTTTTTSLNNPTIAGSPPTTTLTAFSNDANSISTTSTAAQLSTTNTTGMIIIGVVLAFFLVLTVIILIVVVIILKRRKADLPSPGAMNGNVVTANQSSEYEIPVPADHRLSESDPYEKLQLEYVEGV